MLMYLQKVIAKKCKKFIDIFFVILKATEEKIWIRIPDPSSVVRVRIRWFGSVSTSVVEPEP